MSALQELVDAYEVSAIVVILKPNTDALKYLAARSWDYSDHTYAAKLHIEYESATQKGVVDVIELVEEVSIVAQIPQSDVLSMVDAVGTNKPVAVSDVLALVETLSTGGCKSVEDDLSLTDSVLLEYVKIVDDSILAADAVSILRGITVSDTIAVTDQLELKVSFSIADSFGLTDAVSLFIKVSVADAITFIETFIRAKVVPQFWIEVRNTDGELLAVLENVYDPEISEAFDEIPMLSLSIPTDDPKIEYLTPGNWIWVFQQGVPLKIFKIHGKTDTREV